jgi:hypothetical protein
VVLHREVRERAHALVGAQPAPGLLLEPVVGRAAIAPVEREVVVARRPRVVEQDPARLLEPRRELVAERVERVAQRLAPRLAPALARAVAAAAVAAPPADAVRAAPRGASSVTIQPSPTSYTLTMPG